MKTIKEILQETAKELSTQKYYRFHLFMNEGDKKRSVGTAYLQEDSNAYTIKLWTLVREKFYLIQDKYDHKLFAILTKEEISSGKDRSKFRWNRIGSAKADVQKDLIEMSFDLFEKKIYLDIRPILTNTNA
jgi:hypothetical protein